MIKQAIGRIKTASKSLTSSQLDCLDLLRSDHMKMEAMLLQLRISHDPAFRSRMLKNIRTDLMKHMRIEEEIFYPACKEVEDLKGLVEHSYDEHEEVRQMMNQLRDLTPSSKRFSEMVTKIIMNIEHHVITEEDKIFPEVRSKMNEKDFMRMNRMVLQAHHGNGSVQAIAKISRKSVAKNAVRSTRSSSKKAA